jgi:hypothetical protein
VLNNLIINTFFKKQLENQACVEQANCPMCLWPTTLLHKPSKAVFNNMIINFTNQLEKLPNVFTKQNIQCALGQVWKKDLAIG